jgi:hypothetical protein
MKRQRRAIFVETQNIKKPEVQCTGISIARNGASANESQKTDNLTGNRDSKEDLKKRKSMSRQHLVPV